MPLANRRSSLLATIALGATLGLAAPAVGQTPVNVPVVGPAVGASAGAVRNFREGEAEVRSQPLLERPNRLGHFYGNTVRRRHYGTMMVNRRHSDRPVARYLYINR